MYFGGYKNRENDEWRNNEDVREEQDACTGAEHHATATEERVVATPHLIAPQVHQRPTEAVGGVL